MGPWAWEVKHKYKVRSGEVDFGLDTQLRDDQELQYVNWKKTKLVVVPPQGHPLVERKEVAALSV